MMFGLVGCQSTPSLQGPALSEQLAGLLETDLLACAGVPERQMDASGISFFTYTSNYLYQTSTPIYPGYYRRNGYGYRSPWPTTTARTVSYQCEATAEIFRDRVRRVNFNTPTGSSGNWRQCQAIFQNCLGLPRN